MGALRKEIAGNAKVAAEKYAAPAPASEIAMLAATPAAPSAPAAATGAATQAATAQVAAPAGTGMLAAAPHVREPGEWIKAIQKLRTEGKAEQVVKELTEFRKQYPLYPLPDELKAIK